MQRARLFIAVGFSLSALSIVVIFLTFWPVLKEEFGYVARQAGSQLSLHKSSEQISPVDAEFGIVIPKLGANARIIPDVDPYTESVYQTALSKGVAHARGTVYPGDVGNVFLFAHSSVDFYEALRFNSVFYLISKLEKGDEVLLYYKSQKYSYKVTDKRLVESSAVEYLSRETQKKVLTMMTCWPPGTNLKRLIVIAELH